MMAELPATVSAEWLLANLGDPDLVVIDASLQHAVSSQTESAAVRIPRARALDIGSSFFDRDSHLPHMLPSPAQFEVEAGDLGLSNSSKLVVYDSQGVYSSPRIRWMFKTMGHRNVSVLDGGLPAWVEKGYRVESKAEADRTHSATFEKTDYVAHFRPEFVVTARELSVLLLSKDVRVIDARSNDRFLGKSSEPRKGLRSGHIAGSINLPFQQVLNGHRLLDIDSLKSLFEALAERDKRLIFSCGSGVTACIAALGAELAGYDSIAIYDGSWSEWGQI